MTINVVLETVIKLDSDLQSIFFIVKELTGMFIFHPKFMKFEILSDCVVITAEGVYPSQFWKTNKKFHEAAFLWFLPTLNCFICCFIQNLVSSSYSICTICHQLMGVLDAHELGTWPRCIVLPCLSFEFCKLSSNSAVIEVSGYYICSITLKMRRFPSKLQFLFITLYFLVFLFFSPP